MTPHLVTDVAACTTGLESRCGPDSASAYCMSVLEDVLHALKAESVFLFAVGEAADIELLAAAGSRSAPSPLVSSLAAAARRTRRPETGGGQESEEALAALPVILDGEVVAVVVVAWSEIADGPMASCIRFLGPRLVPLALSVDRLRIAAALESRTSQLTALQRQLDAYAVDFRSTYSAEREKSQQLAVALAALEETYRATVHGLAVAVEAKDECTGGHLQRVRDYGMTLTAIVAPEHADDLQFEYGFLLHDIGKLAVPDLVLMKPEALDDAEWAMMREHPEAGHSILEDIPFLSGAREIVRSHHERWDGRGYPEGLAGAEIPLGAQIFPLCDAFDAMMSDRPYRKALTIDEALSEIRRGSGSQFWPQAVEAFLDLSPATLIEIRLASNGS